MLNSVELKNYGPLADLQWRDLGPVNLVIGDNGSGKTFLLKTIYSAMRTLEEYKRGNDPRSANTILAEKLYWTFQAEKIGDLVNKTANGPLSFKLSLDDRDFNYSFGRDTSENITSLENHIPARKSNSIFLPAKEIVSIHHIILKSRDTDKIFGFDDTYYDLAKVLSSSRKPGKNFKEFAASREELRKILGGREIYQDDNGQWSFWKDNQKFSVGVTAEGFKKIGILDILLGNRYLDRNSLLFIDEPESALHPQAISDFLDIIALLAEGGMQFFLASHSYFVVKKLHLIAKEKKMSIPVISHGESGWTMANLRDDMPDNPIIEESIKLYKMEMGWA